MEIKPSPEKTPTEANVIVSEIVLGEVEKTIARQQTPAETQEEVQTSQPISVEDFTKQFLDPDNADV